MKVAKILMYDFKTWMALAVLENGEYIVAFNIGTDIQVPAETKHLHQYVGPSLDLARNAFNGYVEHYQRFAEM